MPASSSLINNNYYMFAPTRVQQLGDLTKIHKKKFKKLLCTNTAKISSALFFNNEHRHAFKEYAK